MGLGEVLQKFVKSRPLAVMTRVILDEVISSDLDQVFHDNRKQGYEQELLYSQLASAISQVVLGLCASPNQAYQQLQDELSVSKTAFYNKLRRVELPVIEASVRHSYSRCQDMLSKLGTRPWEIVPGYHCKIIDGNHLQACENRLTELRTTWAHALPGTAVVVVDAQLMLVQDVFLIPDGHAAERSVAADILETVESNDLWIGDRHYCTVAIMAGIAQRDAFFAIRQHGVLKGELLGKRKYLRRSGTGKIYEQSLAIGGASGMIVRRITVELDAPTEDGDTEVHILSNLPGDVSAAEIANAYLIRREIEQLFYLITTTLTCEIKSLNYPQAALLVFCVALMAMNCRQVLMECLVAVHGDDAVEKVSHYSVAFEISSAIDGLMIAIDQEEWRQLLPKTLRGRVSFLKSSAANINFTRHAKSKRGPKRAPPKKTRYKNGSHLSAQKILDLRKNTC